jgi:hypothetical protein
MHFIAPNDSNKSHNTNSSMAFSLHDNSHSALARDMDDLLQANQNLKQYITSYPFVCHFASIGLYGHARIAISHLQILNHFIHNNASMDYAFVFDDDPKLINDFLMTKTVTAAIKRCGHGIFYEICQQGSHISSNDGAIHVLFGWGMYGQVWTQAAVKRVFNPIDIVIMK